MDAESQTWTDELLRSRWQSLLSVDDLVEQVVTLLQQTNVLDNTYFLYTSDHGYNLGQFRLPSGKFQVYDHNIRVPFYMRGPKIPPKTVLTNPVGNVDVAATIFDLAGGKVEDTKWDGKPLEPLINNEKVRDNWRKAYLVEYWMLGNTYRGAPTSRECNPNEGTCKSACACHLHLEDGPGNTYIALRVINGTENWSYTEFYADENETKFSPESVQFYELYDMNRDPYQLVNVYNATLAANPMFVKQLQLYLHDQYGCTQQHCN